MVNKADVSIVLSPMILYRRNDHIEAVLHIDHPHLSHEREFL